MKSNEEKILIDRLFLIMEDLTEMEKIYSDVDQDKANSIGTARHLLLQSFQHEINCKLLIWDKKNNKNQKESSSESIPF